jgi:hypothetical protein
MALSANPLQAIQGPRPWLGAMIAQRLLRHRSAVMTNFDRHQPFSDEQILQMDVQDAIAALMQSEGLSAEEARELYDRIAEAAAQTLESDEGASA